MAVHSLAPLLAKDARFFFRQSLSTPCLAIELGLDRGNHPRRAVADWWILLP